LRQSIKGRVTVRVIYLSPPLSRLFLCICVFLIVCRTLLTFSLSLSLSLALPLSLNTHTLSLSLSRFRFQMSHPTFVQIIQTTPSDLRPPIVSKAYRFTVQILLLVEAKRCMLKLIFSSSCFHCIVCQPRSGPCTSFPSTTSKNFYKNQKYFHCPEAYTSTYKCIHACYICVYVYVCCIAIYSRVCKYMYVRMPCMNV
jgi:hypothetical protein